MDYSDTDMDMHISDSKIEVSEEDLGASHEDKTDDDGGTISTDDTSSLHTYEQMRQVKKYYDTSNLTLSQ
jgi:hypothetical protein